MTDVQPLLGKRPVENYSSHGFFLPIVWIHNPYYIGYVMEYNFLLQFKIIANVFNLFF